MPPLGLGRNKGAAFGHEFADAYLQQVRETLGALDLHDEEASAPFALPAGPPAEPPAAELARQWRLGPLDAAGAAFDASDRPLLCMDLSADGELAIVGGTDHGLKELSVRDVALRRELFTRTDGHRDWVTCVAALADGRVLSGGADAKLCLWEARGRPARCTELLGHGGSISALAVSAGGSEVVVSASYDKTLRAWATAGGRGGAGCVGVLRAHGAPVMHVLWQDALLASGDRAGQCVSWDLQSGRARAQPVAAHRGHVTAMAAAEPGGGFVSGGHDGAVRLWDLRAGARPALELRDAHVGAVNELRWHVLPTGCPVLVSAGADRRLRVLEPRRALQAVHTCSEHRDFIYSLHTAGGLAFSGGGDGSLLAHELSTGRCLYGLGANRGAVREIRTTAQGALVAAGDDGSVLVYAFETLDGARASPTPPQQLVARSTAHESRPQAPRAAAAGTAARALAPAPAPRGAASGASREAQAYADKRRAAIEHAAHLRSERQAAQRAGAGDGGGGGGGGFADGGDSLGSLARDSWGARAPPPPLQQQPWDCCSVASASPTGQHGGRAASADATGLAAALGGASAFPAQQMMSELDRLHAAGDAKFGRRTGGACRRS